MSDADRERVIAVLRLAVSEGRITLDEFQERVDGVLRSRTFGEVEPYVQDLPAGSLARPVAPPEVSEIRSAMSAVHRRGRWSVPRKLVVHSKSGSVKLDFTEAIFGYPVVEIVLDTASGATTLVLPEGASVNADDVERVSSIMRVRHLPAAPGQGAGPHFVVTGTQKYGSLVIRPQRRFWRWRW